jgi:hypothetical protein
MNIGAGISAGAGTVCLIAAFILWAFVQRRWPRVIVCLIIAGMVGLGGSGLASWIHQAATYGDGLAARFVHHFGGALTLSVVAILAVTVAAVDLVQNKVTGWTVVAAMAAPVVAPMIPGVAGQVATAAMNGIGAGGGMAVGALFGIH